MDYIERKLNANLYLKKKYANDINKLFSKHIFRFCFIVYIFTWLFMKIDNTKYNCILFTMSCILFALNMFITLSAYNKIQDKYD